MLVDIANEQIAQGLDVGILIINNCVNESLIVNLVPEVAVYRFNRRPGSMPLWLLAKLNNFVMRNRPDIVHLHNHKLNGLLFVKSSATLYTVHDQHMPMTYARRNRMAAISEAVRADVLNRVPNAVIRTISNGIHPEDIERRPARMPDKSFRLVQVGRLDSQKKGQDILIKALAELTRRGRNVHVCLIGDGKDRELLKELAEREGVADLVDFRGNLSRKEIYSSLKDFDAMCHPSRYEGFGLTVAEGMAAGLPLIVPSEGGPWEVVDYGRYCRSFETGDHIACADAIEWVMDHYPAALKTADSAVEYVWNNYSVSSMVRNYIDYYTEILNRTV